MKKMIETVTKPFVVCTDRVFEWED